MTKPYILVMADNPWDLDKPSCALYNPVTDCWHEVKSIRNENTDFSVVSLNNQVYAIGGFDILFTKSSSNVMRFQPENNFYDSVAPMFCDRGFFGSCALYDGIFAVGGLVIDMLWETYCEVSDVEFYDPAVNQWLRCPPMTTNRDSLACVSCNDALFAIGGRKIYQNRMSSVERFDPREGKWTLVAPMNKARNKHAALSFNDQIYVTGGEEKWNSCEVYDPRANRWQYLAPMSTGRENHSIVELGGRLHVLGGVRDGKPSTVEVYDPATNRWTPGKPMNFFNCFNFGAAIIQCSDVQFQNIIARQ